MRISCVRPIPCMDRQACIALIRGHIKDEHLVRHCLATGAVMKHAARHLREDEARWERIGILHDIDFEEISGDMQRHGAAGAEILVKEGINPTETEIIRRHNHLLHQGSYTQPVEIVLQAADSVSGLVIACGLVKGGNLSDVSAKTITKKSKEKSFAAGCDRDRIALVAPEIPLPEFYAIALAGLMEIREELGLR
ncbi:putative domain HDIG-containing protein [Methanoregula formicica SMSP]|uniref:Putative domain HDIG-containing protein n=2 Tax=Methanoregula formicica TaxID=882104 RepID=L0HFQ1_METFS|nr:putative domain HDIG-containing protein [Methanoregula formicica SMSP]